MKFSKVLTLLLIIITIAFNAYVNIVDLFGNNISDLAEKYQTLVNPAGYAFSIWSVIYLGLIAFGIWQLVTKRPIEEQLKKIHLLFWINLIANMLWLACFHSESIELSAVVMVIILVTLILIVRRLYIARNSFPEWVKLVFETYLGWICIASVVNFALLLNYKIFPSTPIGNQMWILTGILLIAGLFINFIVAKKGYFAMSSVVFIWAMIAIHLKLKSEGFAYTFMPLVPLLLVVPILLIGLGKALKKA